MNIEEIGTHTDLTHLLSSMSEGDLRNLNNRIIQELRLRSNAVRDTFMVGETVEFTARNGMLHMGTVIKIMPKNIKVEVPNGMSSVKWTVSPNLLRHV